MQIRDANSLGLVLLLSYLLKCVLKFGVKFDLKLEIYDVKNLVKFGGKIFPPAEKALERFGVNFGANFGEKIKFCLSFFSETLFSRRVMLRVLSVLF